MEILFTKFSRVAKFTFAVVLFSFFVKSASAAFVISNSLTMTVGTSGTLTISGNPTNTNSVTYFVNGSSFGSSTTSTTYPFATTPTVPGTYTLYATAYNILGTSLGNTATVTVTVYPAAPITTGGSFCVSGTATLTAAPGVNPSGGNFNWYAAASGGASLQSAAANYYITPFITATTTYYVSYTAGGLESQTRTPVIATQNTQPVLATVPTSPAGGLYLSYPFTGNANDVSGNTNTGVLQNFTGAAFPTLTTDRFGASNSAYNFTASSAYISTTTSVASPGPQNFSISVWFKTTTGGGRLVGFGIGQTGSSGQYDRHIYLSNSGQVFFGLYNNAVTTINTSGTYLDGNWHHIVAIESTTAGASLYVDGAIQAADPTMKSSQSEAGYWRVAYDNLGGWNSAPSNNFYTGTLDDIAIYNTALTATQVYTAYGAGSPPTCVGSPLLLQANGISGCTYGWTGPNGFTSSSQNPTVSNSATTAMAGTYICTVTNTTTGCASVINVTAVVNPLPVATFTLSATQVAPNTNVTITSTGTNPASATYAWNFNGATIVSGSGAGPYVVKWATGGAKTVSLTVTNLTTCAAVSTQTVTVNTANYSTYAYSLPLTLNTTSLGMSTDQTNFPFLVTITDPSLVVKPGGCSNKVQFPTGPIYDFAFVDGTTGTEDNFQIEKYDPVAGTLLVWVKIPTLSHTTNNSLIFYFGSATAPATHTTAWTQATWASDYKAVYHFNEATYTGSAVDATTNSNTGTMTNLPSTNQVAGIINMAYNFTGNSKVTATAVNITGTFTLSAWVNLSAINADQKIMTNQGASGGSTGGYKLGVYNNNLPETESGSAGDRGNSPLPATLTTSKWYYIQGVYSGSTLTTYVNGVQYEVLSTTTNPSSTSNFFIGVGEGGSAYYWHGLIDEPRVSNVAKSTDWINAEYQNQLNPASLITTGLMNTNITNAVNIIGGVTYTTADGVNYTYTINSTTTAGTPATNGTASYLIAGSASLPAAAAIYQLTVNSSNMVDVNGQTLSVGCNIVNNGTITNTSATPSTVIFNGTTATQSYTGAVGSVGNIGNLTVNNSAAGLITITGAGVNVTNSVNLTNGSLFIDNTNSGALTLISTATQTAGVSAIPTGSSITGTVNVQRYLTGGVGYRGYRLMSSPVYAATVSPNNVYSINYLSNNTVLTGYTGTGGGFDKAGNPTLYLYREDQTPSNTTFTSGNFWGISQINNVPNYNYSVNSITNPYNLPVGNGYLFFFRGLKIPGNLAAETTVGYIPVTATLSASGILNQGQVTVHSWYTPTVATIGYTGTGTTGTNSTVRGYNLVGNPYASSIDWTKFNTSSATTGIYGVNISNTIYEFNPVTKNYDTYQIGGASTNKGTNIIVSGQGFFVLATAPNPQLIFNESAKVTTQNTGPTYYMDVKRNFASLNSSNPTNIKFAPHMRLQLALDTINTDDLYLGFSADYKGGYVENEDATYSPGQGQVNIASVSTDNVALAINKRPFPGLHADTIPIKTSTTAVGAYTLNMTEFEAIPQLYEVWLMDRYKKDSLDMRANKSYIFNRTTDTNSYGAKRFSLVIRQNPLLGVHLLSFTAVKATQGAQVAWKVENEQNYTGYAVERSTDNGKTFTAIDSLTSSNLGSYTFVDTAPLNGVVNQYRLKQTDLNGAVTYSKIIPLSYGNGGNSLVKNFISLYPNPAATTLNLSIAEGLNTGTQSSAVTSALYGITIINSTGLIIKTATTTQASWQTDVSALVPGTYIMQVIDSNSKAVIGQSTFIKL